MRRNRKRIAFDGNRVLLTEVLPYEVPLFFSNRSFFDFVNQHSVDLSIEGKGFKYVTKTCEPAVLAAVKLLLGWGNSKEDVISARSTPFNYKINHKENDFRFLSLMHPRSQLLSVTFYEKYQDLILYYCSVSPYSLRSPYRVAKFVNYRDRTHNRLLSKSEASDRVEEDGVEYKSLKSYFSYKKYSNIYKFYESYKYHRCEKKYKNMYKFDISKCFDSIYTHSISWAIYSKAAVKDQIINSKTTFAGMFDKLMQEQNHGETNGILIGPEVSRIFSEIILQRVDRDVHDYLKKNGIIHKVHYEVFRYVDDYFVFFDEDDKLNSILASFKVHLKEYKLYTNDAKIVRYEKPIITAMTIAKNRTSRLFDEKLVLKKEEKLTAAVGEIAARIEKNPKISLDANNLITEFKTILAETKVPYRDIINFSLTTVERKTRNILTAYLQCDLKNEKVIAKTILELLDFTFFIYSVSPRVNSTIKICRTLSLIIAFSKKNLKTDLRHLLFKYIFDNSNLVLKKNSVSNFSQLETVYLLIALAELGKRYWLDSSTIKEHFQIKTDVKTGKLIFNCLNYFTIVSLLFYMQNKKRYLDIRLALADEVIRFLEDAALGAKESSSEKTMLLFDFISCPYVELDKKIKALEIFGVDPVYHDDIIKLRECWFTRWKDFNFEKEIMAKIGNEVY
jgi:hypothetical protein